MACPYLTAHHVTSLIYSCDLSTAKIKQPKKEGMQGITINKETSVSRVGGTGDGLVVVYYGRVTRSVAEGHRRAHKTGL